MAQRERGRRAGTSSARTRGSGVLGGIGNRDWSVGAFGGYLDSRQRIEALAASNRADGFVAGVHGRSAVNGLRLSASVLFDGGDAHTTRSLPNGDIAFTRYNLRSWVGDLSVGYAIPTGGDGALSPKAGITYVRTTPDRAVETGSVFALTVERKSMLQALRMRASASHVPTVLTPRSGLMWALASARRSKAARRPQWAAMQVRRCPCSR